MRMKQGGYTGAFVTAAFLAALLIAANLAAQQRAEGGKQSASLPAPPEQPIPFSHMKHSSIGLKCQACHTNPDPGSDMTFPATDRCLACHGSSAGDAPAVPNLAEFAKTSRAIPWVRVYAVPAFVYWSHRTHLQAGMKCEACHGNVAQMDVVTRVTDVTTMKGCMACHRKSGTSNGCETCHEEKSAQL